MSDLIARYKAIEAIENVDWYHQNRNKDIVSGANDDEHQAWYKADDIYKALESVPSARPKEGEWIEDGSGREFKVMCSNCKCKSWDYITDAQYFDFCPNCGADMKGAYDE